MTKHKAPDLSIVVPMYNEQDGLAVFFERLHCVLRDTEKTFEVVCVNDGSSDDTLERLVSFQKNEYPSLHIVDLSRNIGKEAALSAGIEESQGRAVIVIDADLQDPPELISEFIAKWEVGYDVVYGVRKSRTKDTWFKRITAQFFYAVFNRLSKTKLPAGAGDFRLMDRKVVNALMKMPEHARFMKGIFAWVGFKQTGVPFDRPERHAGVSKWPFVKLAAFALDGIFSFSTVPLRVWSWIGSLTACLGLVYAAFLILRVLVYGRDVPGYASIMVAVLFLGGIQLISIVVLGEYIGRIFSETKNRPLFIVRQTYPPKRRD